MPDTKITALTALTAADPANDVLPIVDVSDTTMAASGTTKKISINNVLGCSGTATLASATITGNLTVDTNTLFVDAANNIVGVGVVPSVGRGAIQLSAGVGFPATQVASTDANTLDDYEEGSWSPTIIAASGTPTTVTVNSATYTKIGRLVVCSFDFSIVDIGTASSSLQFSLPFTSTTSASFCGAFREKATTGSMGQVFYNSATDASCLLYNNNTVWVNGYRISGNYTYFAA